MAVRNGGDANDWFILAMARRKSTPKDEARTWFHKAGPMSQGYDAKNAELRQFWTEAAVLVDKPGPDAPAPAPGSPKGSTAEKRPWKRQAIFRFG